MAAILVLLDLALMSLLPVTFFRRGEATRPLVGGQRSPRAEGLAPVLLREAGADLTAPSARLDEMTMLRALLRALRRRPGAS